MNVTGSSHTLRAYVIGLKLGNQDDLDAAFSLDNFSNMDRGDVTLVPYQSPAGPPGPEFRLVGGGAEAFGGGWLVENRPIGAQWRARTSTGATVKAHHIMINRCPTVPGWVAGGCLAFNQPLYSPGPFNGEAESMWVIPSGWLMTSQGGIATSSSSPARFLTDSIPFGDAARTQQGFTIRSINPTNPNDGAFLNGLAITIKKE